MPLSEREEQILADIEKNLYASDPRMAKSARPRTAYDDELRRLKAGGAVFVLGLALLVLFFVSSAVVAGIAAFGAMVAGIVLITAAVRGLVHASKTGVAVRRQRLATKLQDWEQRLRDRYPGR